MAPPSINENAASLHKIQQKAANCTGMYFYIEDIEEDAVYMYRLSSAEVKIMQQLIAGMSPCATDMEIEIDPAVYISLCFENTGEKLLPRWMNWMLYPKAKLQQMVLIRSDDSC